jgi:hypothetical protein
LPATRLKLRSRRETAAAAMPKDGQETSGGLT